MLLRFQEHYKNIDNNRSWHAEAKAIPRKSDRVTYNKGSYSLYYKVLYVEHVTGVDPDTIVHVEHIPC